MNSNTWLGKMHAHTDALQNLAGQISSLGYAFRRAGNSGVADELLEYATTLQAEARHVSKLTSDKVNSDYHESVQATDNMLSAMLVGVRKPKKD